MVDGEGIYYLVPLADRPRNISELLAQRRGQCLENVLRYNYPDVFT